MVLLKAIFYLTPLSTHFIYGYMASDIWLKKSQRERERARKIVVFIHIYFSILFIIITATCIATTTTTNTLLLLLLLALCTIGLRFIPISDLWVFSLKCFSRHYKYIFSASLNKGAKCSSVVRAFAHVAMGRQIDPSWGGPIHWAISRSSQCSTTGETKAVVCPILSVGWCI